MLNEKKLREKIAELKAQKLSNEIVWTETEEYGYRGDVTEGLRTETMYKLVGGHKYAELHIGVDNIWHPVMTIKA